MCVALSLKKRATQRCRLTSLNPATVRLAEWGFLRYFMYFQLPTGGGTRGHRLTSIHRHRAVSFLPEVEAAFFICSLTEQVRATLSLQLQIHCLGTSEVSAVSGTLRLNRCNVSSAQWFWRADTVKTDSRTVIPRLFVIPKLYAFEGTFAEEVDGVVPCPGENPVADDQLLKGTIIEVK
jgi:hypothetical protein